MGFHLIAKKPARRARTKEFRWSDEHVHSTGEPETQRQKGARADVMTAQTQNQRRAASRQGRSAVRAEFHRLRAAAGLVCLYSEDRKFFLHGELYCALASAIGKGGKSFPRTRRRTVDGISARQGRGSPQAADRAPLHRCRLRRFHQRRRRLLGEPRPAAGVAEQNLANCRVRVESIDVKGAAEFGAALSELGVRVVNRSPDLTVTLVNDYLERPARRIEPAAGVGRDRPGCWCSPPAPFRWWGRCSTRARAPAGPACSIA